MGSWCVIRGRISQLSYYARPIALRFLKDLFVCLKDRVDRESRRKRKGGKKGERGIDFYLLVHSQGGHNNHGWARQKLRASSFILIPHKNALFRYLPRPLGRSWTQNETPRNASVTGICFPYYTTTLTPLMKY